METIAQRQERLSQTLAGAGLRVTQPRLSIYAMLLEGGLYTANELFVKVYQTGLKISVQTIYGVLQSFVDAGLVRRYHFGKSPTRYEIESEEEHDYALCDHCGQVEAVSREKPLKETQSALATSGFHLDSVEVIYHGRCAACQT